MLKTMRKHYSHYKMMRKFQILNYGDVNYKKQTVTDD